MRAVGTLKTLFHLGFSPIRGETHRERLESFYGGQAAEYDTFRGKLLHGRRDMLDSLPITSGGVWYDIGAGTGESARMLEEELPNFSRVYLVDLCPSLLGLARERIADRGWRNVETLKADAETCCQPQCSADWITFSYSLTMIPNWFTALERAWEMLRPGGHIGVVDFYVARKHPAADMARHSWLTRTFWPAWFASDNVFLSADHLPYLAKRFQVVQFTECRGKVPFLPYLRAPYYQFIGRKR